jgi:flagellar biosynthesis protein FlhG
MLQPERFSQEKVRKIKRACCHVFMSEKAMHSVVVSEHNQTTFRYPFLEQLTYEDVKQAYRTNMFTYHPDRHHDKGPEDLDFYARHVEGVNCSYEYLSTLVGEKKAGSLAESVRRSRIIAVGGAKGGIGKSIFAANLGMMLTSMGFKTLIILLGISR